MSVFFTVHPIGEKNYTRVPDIILNKIYPATEWHDVRGPTHLEKDIFPTLKSFLIFFPSVKNTIHLIVELQPQTSIKKEKEKALSSKRNTIIKKEGQKNKKNPSLTSPPMIQNLALIRIPTNAVEVTSEITVSESEYSLAPSFHTRSQTAKNSNITSGSVILNVKLTLILYQ